MSRKRKIVNDPSKICVRPHTYKGHNGKYYETYLVHGWYENGKWQRKQFKELKDANDFANSLRIDFSNQGVKVRTLLTRLEEDQLREAEDAHDKLMGTYTLGQAVEFFLKHHRKPDFSITLVDGIAAYMSDLNEKFYKNGELDLESGEPTRVLTRIRERSHKGIHNVLKLFLKEFDGSSVAELNTMRVQEFMFSLKGKDGVSSASDKTWNNYRSVLNGFFSWGQQKPEYLCKYSGPDDERRNMAEHLNHRPWIFANPVEEIATREISKGGDVITSTSEKVVATLTYARSFKGGALAKYYAIAYFAGIRPDGELRKLASREDELIDLDNNQIYMPSEITKDGRNRRVDISENLRKWLEAYEGFPIIPVNSQKLLKAVRKECGLKHDEMRHSFISYHIGLHRSKGETALQAGNSEAIIDAHYLKIPTKVLSKDFFSIVPSMDALTAVIPDEEVDEESKS